MQTNIGLTQYPLIPHAPILTQQKEMILDLLDIRKGNYHSYKPCGPGKQINYSLDYYYYDKNIAISNICINNQHLIRSITLEINGKIIEKNFISTAEKTSQELELNYLKQNKMIICNAPKIFNHQGRTLVLNSKPKDINILIEYRMFSENEYDNETQMSYEVYEIK